MPTIRLVHKCISKEAVAKAEKNRKGNESFYKGLDRALEIKVENQGKRI